MTVTQNWMCHWIALVALWFCHHGYGLADQPQVIASQSRHLRTGSQPEWSRYAQSDASPRWEASFSATKNQRPGTLLVRHADVRQTWKVAINGKEVGRLPKDENDMLTYFEVPVSCLLDGENRFSIEGTGTDADDIEVGPIHLSDLAPADYLGAGSVVVRVTDADSGQPIPCRLTIVDPSGSLVPVAAESNDRLAVRTGVVYTADGQAGFGLPIGQYRIFAGRGMEYSRAATVVDVQPGKTIEARLSLRRQVDTSGWIACDTHVHSLTHSGHGDASVTERMITLAGEGIELPVATEHNKQIDYQSVAEQLGVNQYFTAVIGNEVTTKFGHFNAFPFRPDTPIPNYRETNWDLLLPAILSAPDVQVVILNHGRDVHGGYRPLAPENFNEATGRSLNGRRFLFNAMETLNSGAQQTDPLELFRDWLAITNHGLEVTPIGSSDSHDVNRYIVGQGRTYVRHSDRDVTKIDVTSACQSIRQGRVSVSAGLFVDVTVDQQYGPGDLVETTAKNVSVRYRVGSPDWIQPSRVQLFQNGIQVREQRITADSERQGTWTLPTPPHDVFLTVLATGPGPRHPAWPIAQPYQADGPDWDPTALGFSGAIRIDVDGDGRFQTARQLASELVMQAGDDFAELLQQLASYDSAVVMQAAELWQSQHGSLLSDELSSQWRQAAPSCKTGIAQFLTAWRKSQIAAVERN